MSDGGSLLYTMVGVAILFGIAFGIWWFIGAIRQLLKKFLRLIR